MERVKKESQNMARAEVLIPTLLNECQKSLACHPRAIKQMADCLKNNPGDFLEFWTRCMRPVFLISKREPAIERIVSFAASFITHRDEAHAKECDKFFDSFLSTLLDWAEAAHNTVRFRACQMVSEAVSKLEPNREVSEELWDRITSTMLTRMQDKQTNVREFAVKALSRLFVGDDIENDAIVQAYRKALRSDQRAVVREMVVKSMPPANATVSDVVERISDVSESVRKAAYQTISRSFPAHTLSITQRAMTIERGLAERIPAVREECESLLEKWLREDCHGDPLMLMRYLDVETHEKVGETAMLELLKKTLIKFSDTGLRNFLVTSDGEQRIMTAEEALFFRVVCEHVHSLARAKGCEAANNGGAQAAYNAAVAGDQNEHLDSILPATVSEFVQIVEIHLHKGSVAWFAARQMLHIAKLMNLTDSTSRKNAGVLLQRLLRETAPSEEHRDADSDDHGSEEWVGDGLNLGGEESWAIAVAEFARHVHASSGEFEEVMTAAVAEVGRPCREGGAHVAQWLHCLAVTGLLLENITSLNVLAGRSIEPEEILQSLLLPAAKHLHPEVQRAGVRCLAIFCCLERSLSPRAVDQLRLSLHSASPQVQKMALKAMFDLILCHGAAAIDRAASVEPDLGLPTPQPRPPGHHILDYTGSAQHLGLSEMTSRLPVLDRLEQFLRGEDILVDDGLDQTEYVSSTIAIAAEGFARVLLQNKRFPDVQQIQERIVEELLEVYFSESNEHSPGLKQCLVVFFRIWCSLSAANKKCIATIFIPVVRKKWPGLCGDRVKVGAKRVAQKHAKHVAYFMLDLLQVPLVPTGNQRANQRVAEQGEDGATCNQHDPQCANDLDEGVETSIFQILAEVKSQGKKFTSLSMQEKSYTAMLCRIIPSVRFSPSRQENIKALRSLIQRLVDWLQPNEKTLCKSISEVLERLKDLDAAPDVGLTDEELELFIARMGFHDYFKEETPDSSAPEPESVARTEGRVSSSRARVSGRQSRASTASQTARSRTSQSQRGATMRATRKNLTSVYESLSDESDSSAITSESISDSEVEF